MKLELRNTEYGSLVQQLGDLDVFCAVGEYFQQWFTTKEEARQSSLNWQQIILKTYKRSCPGRDFASNAVATLQKEAIK